MTCTFQRKLRQLKSHCHFMQTLVRCSVYFMILSVSSAALNAQESKPKPASPQAKSKISTDSQPDKESPQETDAKKDDKTETSPETKPEVKIPPPPTPWILKRYRVQVFVSFETDPLLSARTLETTIKKLKQHLDSQFHEMWELEVLPGINETWFSQEELKTLSSDSLPTNLVESEFDKIFFATLAHQAGSYSIHVREWDESSRTLGSLHTISVASRREIVANLAKMTSEAFRPIAKLEVVDDNKIEFLVRGGEYLPRNTEMQQFRKDDFLVPYLRYLNRKREVQKIQPLPWTYMQVESVVRSRIKLSMTSAFGNPVAGKRRRVEIHAMRIRPYLSATEIFIYPRGEKQNPLVGYRCEVMDRVPTEEDKVEDRLKLETDRRGIVTVPVVEKSPLQYLYVYSGQALLAKVPFIPGYSPRLEVEVPDDRPRLNVEGEVSLMQGELIDIVATREVLMARTRGAAKSKKWDDVGRFLSQLQDLPTLDDFSSRIASIQVRAVQAAKIARDRVAEIRVKRLCTGIQESAEKHLDPFRIAEFRREMNELKRNTQK